MTAHKKAAKETRHNGVTVKCFELGRNAYLNQRNNRALSDHRHPFTETPKRDCKKFQTCQWAIELFSFVFRSCIVL